METKVNKGEKRLYEILDDMGVEYKVYEHEAFATVQQADEKGFAMPGLNLKCLVNKDKKTDTFYLIILDDHKQMDGKKFKALTGWKKTSFANAHEVYDKLGLIPGSVSPFGLVNNRDNDVVVVLERDIYEAADTELLNFHPCRNTATLALCKKDFVRFLEHMGNQVIWDK